MIINIKPLLKALLIIFALFIGENASAQKVANYATGQPGSDNYKGYSFWMKNGKAAEITYRYGAARTEVKARYGGRATYRGYSGFKVMLPNNDVFYMIPMGNKLRAVNAASNMVRIFAWEYEGPVNGVGTYCDVCTQDDKEAMALIKGYYVK